MYCLMPSKAYEGDIQVTIKDGEKTYTSEKSDGVGLYEQRDHRGNTGEAAGSIRLFF